MNWVKPESHIRTVNGVIGLVLTLGFMASYVRANAIEEYRYFVTPADVTAMDWIKDNTPLNARFAINTARWSGFPYGTDAGYWLPYFTGRQTTAGILLLALEGKETLQQDSEQSRIVLELINNPNLTRPLQTMGVSYIYLGSKGNFSGPGLNPQILGERVKLLYNQSGVSIWQILP